ncbi:hypothetical protein GCM10027053_36520 [Intrasporangium mesophilum]
MSGVIMVEGLPGSGKSTTAHGLGLWLAAQGVRAEHFAEGRVDHPVDFEQVAVLTNDDLVGLLGQFPADASALIGAAERSGDAWLVRYGRRRSDLPRGLVSRLRDLDGYDGSITPELHARVLADSWRRFGREPRDTIQIWECVLLQNPVCALVARFDQPDLVLERHVQALVETVSSQSPALVYLDPGDPGEILERAAAERPQEWLDRVVGYHTKQGYGLARGLHGFEGYVEFMRYRRHLELDLLPRLDVPTLVVEVGDGRWTEHTQTIQSFVGDHLGIGQPEPREVA